MYNDFISDVIAMKKTKVDVSAVYDVGVGVGVGVDHN